MPADPKAVAGEEGIPTPEGLTLELNIDTFCLVDWLRPISRERRHPDQPPGIWLAS